MEPSVSIVIPVFDAEEELNRCLRAVHALRYDMSKVEVIVVDNKSSEPIHGIQCEFPRIRIVEETTPGSYAARNAGIRAASGKILAFTDADCIPRRDWLEKGMAHSFRSREYSVVGGHVRMFIPKGMRRNPAALYDLCLGLRQEKYWAEDGFLITANLFVPAIVFRLVGLFRTDVFSGGDAEWSRRAAERDVALRYAPDAVVEHPVRADWGALRRKVLRIAQGGSDPVYRTALNRSRRQHRMGSGRLAAARRVFRSRELRNWRERASVFLVAIVVVVWKLEGKLRYKLNREAYR